MKNKSKSKSINISFMAFLFFAVVYLAFFTQFREGASVILLIPLIWCFIKLSPVGMITSCLILIVTRITIEMLLLFKAGNTILGIDILNEAIFPSLLYISLGISFYIFRVHHAKMVDHIGEKRSIEAMEQLSAGLAHDFGNILQIILGTAGTIKDEKTLDAETMEKVDIILDAANQAGKLVKQMRNFSERSMNIEVTDLSKLVAQQIKMIKHSISKDIELIYNTHPNQIPVKVDPQQINRVVTNLCSNAKKAMPNGGILTIKTDVLRHQSNTFGVLSVCDTGPGIRPKNQKQIFKPFYSIFKAPESMGIGLPIVQSIVQAYNGRIELESKPGEGTTFHIQLPLAG